MSYELKLVTCGTHDSIENTELCLPLINKILFDPTKIKTYIAKHSKWVFFIVVLLSMFDQTIDGLLLEIGNKDNIIAIFICGNQIHNLANNQTNVFYLSNRLLTCKTTQYAIRSYQSASEKFYKTSHKGLAYILEQKCNNLKRWRTTNDKVKTYDILMVPLNTADDNFHDAQQRVIQSCKDLFWPDHEITVGALSDCIPSDESDPNMSEEERSFVNEKNKIICSLKEKIAPIRIYVVGNEDHIPDKWSQLMMENELDNGGQNAPKYDERCTFLENEPVTSEAIHNLIRRYGHSWQMTNIKPTRLDTIRDDIYFHAAVDRSHTTLDNREMSVNVELNRWTMNYHENSTKYSSEFCQIEDAQCGPTEQGDNVPGEINNRILFDYQTGLSNRDTNG